MSYRFHNKPRNKFPLPVVFAFFLVNAWIIGLVWFVETLPTTPHFDTTSAPRTDAIVVLTGGSGRLETGLNLLSNGIGRKLFVSGVYHGVEVSQLLQQSQKFPEKLECCIDLGYAAANTYGNAKETAAWMRQQGFSSLTLVTAHYHMRRALIEFHRMMPDTRIVPHPVVPPNFVSQQWWLGRGNALLLVSEYNKYLITKVKSWAMPTPVDKNAETE